MLIFSLSMAGYGRLSNRQLLISNGQNLKNILRDIQSRAYTNEVDCNVCDCDVHYDTLLGWSVDLENRYVYGRCSDGTQFPNPTIGLSINDKIQITPLLTPGSSTINFIPNPPSSEHNGYICLKMNEMGNYYFQIDLSNSGDIYSYEDLNTICPITPTP